MYVWLRRWNPHPHPTPSHKFSFFVRHGDHTGGLPEVLRRFPSARVLKWKGKTGGGCVEKIQWEGRDTIELFDEELRLDVDWGEYGAPRSLVAVPSPGHTEDHCCFFMPESGILFTGDAVLGYGSTVFETLYDHLQSLHSLLKCSPSIICPSHGPLRREDTASLISSAIQHRREREEIIIEVFLGELGGRCSGGDLCTAVYSKELPPDVLSAVYGRALHSVTQHMLKLEVDGQVKRESEHDGNEGAYIWSKASAGHTGAPDCD